MGRSGKGVCDLETNLENHPDVVVAGGIGRRPARAGGDGVPGPVQGLVVVDALLGVAGALGEDAETAVVLEDEVARLGEACEAQEDGGEDGGTHLDG
jgi:hypothetical protein